MARIVAVLRFEDNREMFGVYCNTMDALVSRELFDTSDMAAAAVDAWEASGGKSTKHSAPHGASAAAEPVTVMPYKMGGSGGLEFPSTASRKHRWLTGSKSLDEWDREQRHNDDGSAFYVKPTAL
jgi:hypothetical protein